MQTRSILPAHLIGTPFTSAQARESGVDPWRLSAPDLHRPFHAIYSTVAPRSVSELCRAYLHRLPSGALFSHQTAAALLGVPLPHSTEAQDLHVSVPFPRCPPRGRGVVGHSLKAVSRATAGGFPICAPSEVWVQLSGVVGPEDLVAAGDHLVGARRRPALATVAELATASERCSHSKGARSREWALSRIRWGADSRPESLLRLLLGDLGLEGLEVNPPIVVGDGTVTLHPDLTLPDRRLVFEYEGDGHRADARQWRLDIERRELLEERGWRVVRVTASDLFGDRAPFLRRLGRFVPNVA